MTGHCLSSCWILHLGIDERRAISSEETVTDAVEALYSLNLLTFISRATGHYPYISLRLIPTEKGHVLRYDRGITDQYHSTVAYASMAFF